MSWLESKMECRAQWIFAAATLAGGASQIGALAQEPAPTAPPVKRAEPVADDAAKPPAPKPVTPSAESPASPAATGPQLVTWAAVTDLPAVPGQSAAGLSGVFAGALDSSHAVVAGGSFYPDKGPLDGGQKSWTDAILVLEQKAGGGAADPEYSWVTVEAKLPRPMAGGVSIALDEGVLCCGGADATACHADCFVLEWNAAEKRLDLVDFPPLPKPLSFAGGARAGNWVLIAGGSHAPGEAASDALYGLDLSQRGNPAAFQWQTLPSLPRAVIFPVCAGQNDGEADVFYLFSGRGTAESQGEQGFRDAQKFHPGTKVWQPLGRIQGGGARAPASVMAGTAVAIEPRRVLLLGGDDGEVARLLDANARRSGSPEEVEAYR